MAGTSMAEPPGRPGWIVQHMFEPPRPSERPGAQARSVQFQINDHAVGGLDEGPSPAVPQGSFDGSLQRDELMRVLFSEDTHAQAQVPERALTESTGEIALNNQQHSDPAPCRTRPEPRNVSRKRDRDSNWTKGETAFLVECKRTAFHDKGSRFRKQKPNATNWDAISQGLRNNPDTRASEKTGDQCRLRWDTLVKSHRIIKEKLVQINKGYAELTEEELNELKLATTLNKGWYEVIDTIKSKSKSVARSQKRGKRSPSVGDVAIPESRIASVPLDQLVGSRNAPSDPESPPVFLEGPPAVSRRKSPSSSPSTQDSTERPERRKSSRKQIAIPGFSSMDVQLRATLLDLILDAGFIEGRYGFQYSYDRGCKSLSVSCRWLSIVQNRSCSEVYDDVSTLVNMKLVDISQGRVNQSRFRVFDKFVKKVIHHNPVYDTHLRIRDPTMSTLEACSLPQRIRVLRIDRCGDLTTANFRGLRKLRSLRIEECSSLVEVFGLKYLRELGWLEICSCPSYRGYPDLQDLPSLREFCFSDNFITECPLRLELDISRCVRLRSLRIACDYVLEGSWDLSSLKCLEILTIRWCSALSTISGLSGLHLLTHLDLEGCKALQRLPDIGHMNELEFVGIASTGLEEIPGVENLVSLKKLICFWSKLKNLPDLHHLPHLEMVFLKGTPLIEEDPSSFYFDKDKVVFNSEERGHVDVSDISDTEDILSDTEDLCSDDSLSSDDSDFI